MSLTYWKPIHETISNFGADCAVLDSQVEQLFLEVEQLYGQLVEYAEQLAERERRLVAREQGSLDPARKLR